MAFHASFIAYDIEGALFTSPSIQYSVDRAHDFDFIVAQAPTNGKLAYQGHVNAMLNEKANLYLMVYINLWHHNKRPGEPGGVDADWYVLDANDDLATGSGLWSGNYLMNPRKGGWVEYQIALAAARFTSSGYPHLYVDGGGLGPLATTKRAIDPDTNDPWTKDDWVEDIKPVWAQLRDDTRIGGHNPVRKRVANNLGDPELFNLSPPGNSASMLGGSPAYFSQVVTETYLRGSSESLTSYPSQGEWEDFDAMVGNCNGKFTGLTKLWRGNTELERATSKSKVGRMALKNDWHAYALATYMVSAKEGDAFYCTYDHDHSLPLVFHKFWSHAKALGDANGVQSGSGVRRRDFAHGKVAVNITSSLDSVNISSHAIDERGREHRAGSVRLPPKSGILLRYT